MEKIFLSQQNIISLTKKLILYLELDETQINKEVVLKCKKIITNYMNVVFDKYGNKNLVISYNTKAFPSISEIETKLKKKYSNVITKYTDYNYALSKTKSQEVVILALVT